MSFKIPFDNSYARFPQRFFSVTQPTPVALPKLVKVNEELALQMGFDREWLSSEESVLTFSGNRLPENAQPIATAYAGHQFGNFVPQLGDGRAILLGEVVDRLGVRRDVQLKGSGPTPFSRRGDGRAALGPVLREYVVSEAMERLGIPTTRALAAVTTGEMIARDSFVPGAVLTRVAASHIRIGTFQYFANRGDLEGVRLLAEHVLNRHYPEAVGAERPYRELLTLVVQAQARLIAQWLLIGFIHGVMNTDNMSICGETIDYGPCAFMDEFNPQAVYSAIDRNGRYAFQNQPAIALWNLTRFAETLLPLLADDPEMAVASAEEVLATFGPTFERFYRTGLRLKLGLFSERDKDDELGRALLDLMAANGADFTLTFRRLSNSAGEPENLSAAGELFPDSNEFKAWSRLWRQRIKMESVEPLERRARMRAVNPLFIPRNHRIEAVIRAAVDRNDFAPFEELLTVLSNPFVDQPEYAHYAEPPKDHERVHQTFCGT